MGNIRSGDATYHKLLGWMCFCVLAELLLARFAARSGFFIPRSGLGKMAYDAAVFTGLVAFNLSSVLVYILICLRLYALRNMRDLWERAAMASISTLAFLSLLRLIAPFSQVLGTVYQLVFLSAILSGLGAAFGRGGERTPTSPWWALPFFFVFLSQFCAGVFVLSQNLADGTGASFLRFYQAGEILFVVSAWAFWAVAVKQFKIVRRDDGSLKRRAAAIGAGIFSIVCGAGLFVLCKHSPYPRQMIMFATGLTMYPAGAALCSASFAAVISGLAVCFLSGAEGRRIGMCFFLVMACGYDIEMTHYYLLAALGLWSISAVPQSTETQPFPVTARQASKLVRVA